MTFRPHPKQAEFMREPAIRIVIGGGYATFYRGVRISAPSVCRRTVEHIRQAPEGAAGLASIDMIGTRPCGGRLIDGKCEFCDVTTIEDG